MLTYQKLLIKNSENFLAYNSFTAELNSSRVIFLGGFKSTRFGTKAQAIFNFCQKNNISCTIFDYFGHGDSSGDFIDGTIGGWLNDSLNIIDHFPEPQILIGSSMGAWLMLHAAKQRPNKIKALIGIAAAPDFTEDEIWAKLDPSSKQKFFNNSELILNKKFAEEPLLIRLNLIEEARKFLILQLKTLELDLPIRLLHSMEDDDISYHKSIRLTEILSSQDIELHLFKNGNHRLDTPEKIKYIFDYIIELQKKLDS